MSDSSSTIISGAIADESAPHSATWELLDSFSTRQYVDFTDNLEFESETDSWKVWSFSIEINPIIVGPCACTIVVTTIDDSGYMHTKLLSIFISPNTHQLPPTIHIYEDSTEKRYSQRYIVNAHSWTVDLAEPIFEYTFMNSTNVKCSDVESQNISDLPDDLIRLNSSQLSFGVNEDGNHGGPFSFEIDLTHYPDGWYDFVIYATNPLNQEFAFDCASIRVDNNPPVALIEGPSTILEGIAAVVIDGSSSYDLNWGIQGLTYIWSVIEVGGGYVSSAIFVVGTDERSISIYPTESGTYVVNLAVSDQAGNIGRNSQIIEIQNIAPIVRLTIDGIPISSNDEFILQKGSTVHFDASGSTDTSNDALNLRYVWRVNNIPTYEGESREFIWPDGIEGEFILTIEVIDDDSESSQISILVKDGSVDSPMSISIVILILSTLFFSYSIVNMRKQDNESDIPKW
ncbi:MAG: hypothetical protein P8Q46_03035 [Candidatus Thalassarchaeaceae archaeon]|nr:hypothetical protein [Candidatus Thalassarchaeaceae archaeon]